MIRVDDYSKIKEAHDEVIAIINKHQMSALNAIGLLELVKQEILTQEED